MVSAIMMILRMIYPFFGVTLDGAGLPCFTPLLPVFDFSVFERWPPTSALLGC